MLFKNINQTLSNCGFFLVFFIKKHIAYMVFFNKNIIYRQNLDRLL